MSGLNLIYSCNDVINMCIVHERVSEGLALQACECVCMYVCVRVCVSHYKQTWLHPSAKWLHNW